MILWLILIIPLIAAGLSSWRSSRRTLSGAVTVIAMAAEFLLALAVAERCASGTEVIALSGWVSCDAFGALVLVLCSFAGLTSALFSIGFTRRATDPMEGGRVRRYFVRFNLFAASVLAVPLLADVALVWIAVALTTLLSVFLVSFDRTTAALEAAWKYAILTSMGAALALFGVLLLYWAMRQGGAESFTWAGLAAAAGTMPPFLVQTAFLFMLVGYGTKAALVPFHAWLPDVYSQAPIPICSLLSVTETTVLPYVIVRLLPLFPGRAGDGAGRWLVAFGLFSTVGAALLLIQVKDLKRLFAYSTIENAGIILAAAGLGGAATFGSLYQLMAHALVKPFGFFAAGAALLFAGTTEIGAVHGLGRRSPLAGTALLAGALAVTGAPPFALFLSELSILLGGTMDHRFFAVAILVACMAGAFCAVLYHVTRMVFGKSAETGPAPPFPRSYALALVAVFLPVLAFGVGLPAPVEHLLRLAATALGR
jgi:hydrogenase-4 component F